MSPGRLPARIRVLALRETWIRIATYALVISSTFSIAGATAAIFLLYVAVLYHRFRQPMAEPLPRWLVIAFFLLPAAALAAALANGIEAPLPVSDSPTRWDNLGELRGFYRIVLPLALVPALGTVNRRRLLVTLLVFSAAMALYALVQFRWGVDWFRPEGRKVVTPYAAVEGVYHGNGNFSTHLTFAGVMLMLVPLFASLAASSAGRRRLTWGLGAGLVAVGVGVSLSRGGWLGMGVALLLLALRFPRRLVAPLVALVGLLALAWMLFGTGWLQQRVGGPHEPALVQRLLSASLTENRERLYLWQSGLMGLKDRPMLGVGYGNDAYYAPAYRREIAERERFTFRIGLDTHMHNVYLQLGFELGLLGLVAYLVWMGAIFHWSRKWLMRADGTLPFDRAVLYGASAGLAGSMAAGFFENNFFDGEVQTVVLILMGLSLHAGLMIRRELGRGSLVG